MLPIICMQTLEFLIFSHSFRSEISFQIQCSEVGDKKQLIIFKKEKKRRRVCLKYFKLCTRMKTIYTNFHFYYLSWTQSWWWKRLVMSNVLYKLLMALLFLSVFLLLFFFFVWYILCIIMAIFSYLVGDRCRLFAFVMSCKFTISYKFANYSYNLKLKDGNVNEVAWTEIRNKEGEIRI